MKATDSITHTIHTTGSAGNRLDIHIRLNDECNNGHADFAITGSGYDKKSRSSYGGCCHDEILKVRPDLKIFVDLHLSTADGVPMYAIENGYFHLQEGKKDIAKEYIRASNEQWALISQSADKEHYQYLVESAGLLGIWRAQAKSAIAMLEEMTGNKFKDSSTKKTFKPLTKVQKNEIESRILNGYYLPSAIAARKAEAVKEAKEEALMDLLKGYEKEIAKKKTEYLIKRAVIEADLPIGNFIYYNHSNEAVFNWSDSSYSQKDNITKEQFEAFTGSVDLPFFVNWKFGK
jgi:hypothetical protein